MHIFGMEMEMESKHFMIQLGLTKFIH